MSNCWGCNMPIDTRPLDKGCPGGDWVSSCSICGWHSEDEGPHSSIRKSLSPGEIVDIKVQINTIRHHLRFIIAKDNPLHTAFQMLSASLLHMEEKI